MKTPPATSIRLGASWWYRGAVLLIAIFLVAAYAMFYWASGVFGIQHAVLGLAAASTLAWALADAWQQRQGALHYADGQWVLAQGEHEAQGTLHLVLDLQNYLLVRFTPLGHRSDATLPQQHTTLHTPRWLHLESRHAQQPSLLHGERADHWRALRRALLSG